MLKQFNDGRTVELSISKNGKAFWYFTGRSDTHRTHCNDWSGSRCAKKLHSLSGNRLSISGMNFQVRVDFHTWEKAIVYSMMDPLLKHYINVVVQRDYDIIAVNSYIITKTLY